MSGDNAFFIVHGIVCALIFVWMAVRIYGGFTTGRMSVNGMGGIDRNSNPALFWIFGLSYGLIMVLVLVWSYGDYVRLFGPIPGFHPEMVVDAVIRPIRHAFHEKGNS